METCLNCKQPITNIQRKKFCSDKCKIDYFNKVKYHKEAYDPLLALWAAVVLPDDVSKQIKDALHIHYENIRRLSELGKIMFNQVQRRADEMGTIQFLQEFLVQVNITFSSLTFSSAGL